MTNHNLTELIESSLSEDRLDLIRHVADEASRSGYSLYMVGGSVRDLLLGRRVMDFDLVVEGDAIKFGKILVEKIGGELITHLKFGTAVWSFPKDQATPTGMSGTLDLITARSESYAYPGALPTVKFSVIEEDLNRRDFTINAMAARLDGDHFGMLIDPLNGRTDLELGMIRALHPKSFMDDPTRIFRAVRYAVRYGFKIEPSTSRLINAEALGILSHLSGERLRHEFDLIFEEQNALEMLAQLNSLGALHYVHDGLRPVNYVPPTDYELPSGFEDLILPEILSFRQALAWILWLAPLSSLEIEAISERLAFPSLLMKAAQATSLLFAAKYARERKNSQWTFFLDEFPVLSVYAAWVVAPNETYKQTLRRYLLKWRRVKPFTTGDDLKRMGLGPGPRFREILTHLRAAWLDEEVKTKEEEQKLLGKLI